jgi:hypothetical protein
MAATAGEDFNVDAYATGLFYGWLADKFFDSSENGWNYKASDPALEGFGNFNYGAIMDSLGFSSYTAENIAGIIQLGTRSDLSQGFLGLVSPYGDQQTDNENIRLGYRTSFAVKIDACHY